ncbi:choice-of-anchor A family protein [Kitasatospora sp. NPDC052896]|uniref:choice-of-anchor A family protein n=1 Tax=Kitasatospora sp. NPDC052896 TaxID=3364061 RepID=UPI0037C88454
MTAALVLQPLTAVAAPFPPLGACSGPDCPASYPPPNNGDFAGRDATINVFAGGNYTVEGRAAEAEGKIVTLGNLTVAKVGGGAFNMGVVGVGSRVPPPSGTDHVTVGGNVLVYAGNRVLIGGSDSRTTVWGNLRYGGTTTGTVELVPPGAQIHDPTVGTAFAPVRTTIARLSACTATAAATGTVTVTNSEATFTGDGTSTRQIFDVNQSLTSASGGQIGLVFRNIPAGATVVVNMLPENAVINTYSGTGQPGDPLTGLRPKLLWNFPAASSARITGGAQFQGSVLAGNPNGTTRVDVAGLNGRVYLAGNLVQAGTGGYEIHAYDFTGDLPGCGIPTPTPTPMPTPTPPIPTPTLTPTPTARPSWPGSHTPWPTGGGSGSGGSGWGGHPSGGGDGQHLANAGDGLADPGLTAAGLLLVAGGVTLLVGRRRGRHG